MTFFDNKVRISVLVLLILITLIITYFYTSRVNSLYIFTSADKNFISALQERRTKNISIKSQEVLDDISVVPNFGKITDTESRRFVSAINNQLVGETFYPSYRVQAFDYIKNDKRQLYFNGFCFYYYQEFQEVWRNTLIAVNDGGKCFFYGTYDITDQEIIQFDFHF